MKRIVFLLVLLSLPFVMTVRAARPQLPKPPAARDVMDLSKLRQLDRFIKQAVSEDGLPSVVCYASYNGKPFYFKSFGFADRENLRTLKKNAIFRLGSQTKLVTTVALMSLYEKGLFSLEDPVKKFLPEFSHPMVYVSGSVQENNLITRPAYGDITIRQLLSNTSGIAYEAYNQMLHPINYPVAQTTREVVGRIAQLPLKFDPGEGFVDGYGVDVAGCLAEVISGMRLDSLMRKTVFSPLDMKDTYFYLPWKKMNKLVALYQKPGSEVGLAADTLTRFYPLAQNQLYFGGGAGLSASVEDYARLCHMIMNQGRVGKKHFLSRKTVEQMTVDQTFGIEGNFLFGLGMKLNTEDDFAKHMLTPWSMSGEGEFGTKFLIDPQHRLVVMLFTNKVEWSEGEEIWGRFVRTVFMSLR